MEETNIAFNEYIDEFKKMSIIEKREEVLKSIKELIAFIEKFSEIDNIPLEFLKSREILDIEQSNTEDDFLEAEIVYIENAKILLGSI